MVDAFYWIEILPFHQFSTKLTALILIEFANVQILLAFEGA